MYCDRSIEFLEEIREREKKTLINRVSDFTTSLVGAIPRAASLLVKELTKAEAPVNTLKSREEKRKRELSLQQIIEEEEKEKKGVSVSWHLEQRMRNMRAKMILIDHAVAMAEQNAVFEYRKAHPAKFCCIDCNQAFPDEETYHGHVKDKSFHREFIRQKVLEDDRFLQVYQMFLGEQGRQLKAQRLIFSVDLGSQQVRIDGAVEEPFRPMIADKGGKRHKQILKGMFVQGFDPKSGIRPNHKRLGLVRQHQAVSRTAGNANSLNRIHHPVLQEVILDLMRCQDNFIDLVSATDHPNHHEIAGPDGENSLALVRFEWNEIAHSKVQILGEFTDWQPVEMPCDVRTDRFFFTIELGPGRYRYRFLIDGAERVDQIASQTDDPTSPIGKSNELLVTKAPLMKQDLKPKIENENEEGVEFKIVVNAGRGTTEVIKFDGKKLPGAITHVSKGGQEEMKHRLENLNLRNLALYDDGVNALVAAMRKNSIILSIDLSYNDISDEGVQALSGGLLFMNAIKELKLNGNGIGLDSCRYLTASLKQSKSIKRLELANNRIGDDGFEVFCQYLIYNMTLEELYLDGNVIGDDGIECFQEAMFLNRTLKSLSIGSNRITKHGAKMFAAVLYNNASLTSFDLSNNSIGADGMKCIGDLMYFTNTIVKMGLAHVDLFSHRSQLGFHAICDGIKANKSLTSLNLSNNSISTYHAETMSHVMSLNEHIVELDLSFNPIHGDWFVNDKMMPTHLQQLMPSIATSLHKNKIKRNRTQAGSYDIDPKRFIVDDCIKGRWTNRREWRQVLITEAERAAAKLKVTIEHERIRVENEWIKKRVVEYMNGIKFYLSEQPCKQYLHMVAKFITQYIYDLPQFDPEVHNLVSIKYDAEMDRVQKSGKLGSMRAKSIELKQSKSLTQLNANSSSLTGSLSSKLVPINSKGGLEIESFMNAHVSVMNALFNTIEGGSTSMLLHPERLQQALQMIGLPIAPEEVQAAVDQMLIPGINRIGLHKFSDFVLHNAKRLSQQNSFQRMRIMADLFVNPPLNEAKAIILDNLHHRAFIETRMNYRLIPENKPKYMCEHCLKRFASEPLYHKHMKRGIRRNPYHKRLKVKEMIQHSQNMFLQQVKSAVTGVFYPAYYELLPPTRLPKEYMPQIFDLMGQAGRPFGVVESFRTIRALDVLGDYIMVSLSARLGWVRYKKGRHVFLRPIRGFDWDRMHIQDSITYYRVNDNLPKEIELKVRHRPALDADVVGYVKRGEIIQCMAVIDDWIQVKHGNEDAAWLLVRSPLNSEVITLAHSPQPMRKGRASSPERKNFSPIRKRKVDNTTTPQDVQDEDEDLIFNDNIVTYEIDGKRYRNNVTKNPSITKIKVAVFNEIRYGDPDKGTSQDHILPIPSFIQKRIVPDPHHLPPTPTEVSQKQIFDILVNCDESEIREWELVEAGFVDMDRIVNRFGASAKDAMYEVEDDEDLENDEERLH